MTTEPNELDLLQTEAAAVDALAAGEAAGPGAPGAPEQPAADPAAEVAALLQLVAGMLAPMFPSLAEIYTQETCRALGAAAAPVLAKHQVSLGGIFDRWGPEIALAAAALPVGVATVKGIRADLDAGRRKPAKAVDQEPEAGHAAGAVMVVG